MGLPCECYFLLGRNIKNARNRDAVVGSHFTNVREGFPHDEYYCTYWFHGVMSNIQVGHQISYYDYISFRKTVAGRPGTAWVDCSGIFIVTNRTR